MKTFKQHILEKLKISSSNVKHTLFPKTKEELKEMIKDEISKNITVYSNTKNNIKLNIVVSNNNIYIESLDNRRIEIIDENSTIQMIDDNYKNISKDDISFVL